MPEIVNVFTPYPKGRSLLNDLDYDTKYSYNKVYGKAVVRSSTTLPVNVDTTPLIPPTPESLPISELSCHVFDLPLETAEG